MYFIVLSANSAGFAADMAVHASLNTRKAISLAKTQDMNFGTIEYDAVHTGQIILGTDGSVSLGGAGNGILLGGTAKAGQIGISGDNKSIIEISCSGVGSLSDGFGQSLPLTAVEYAIDNGVAGVAGTACNGLGIAPSLIDLSAQSTPEILMGGTVDVGSSAITNDANFSTANAGGSPVTLRVVYQ